MVQRDRHVVEAGDLPDRRSNRGLSIFDHTADRNHRTRRCTSAMRRLLSTFRMATHSCY